MKTRNPIKNRSNEKELNLENVFSHEQPVIKIADSLTANELIDLTTVSKNMSQFFSQAITHRRAKAKLINDTLTSSPEVGICFDNFLTDKELITFAKINKHAPSFFAGALELRARANLIKYAFHNKQNIIQEIFKRYPGLQNDKQLMLSLYLHHISFGQPNEAISLLKENPQFANEFGTVITHSGHTIENVTGIQLAYVLEDEEIGNKIWDCLDDDNKENARQQLAIKIDEVEEQESQFVDYDYTALVSAITKDKTLKNLSKDVTGREKASPETEQVLDELSTYFKPGVVKKGKPFNMRHLCKAYEVYVENYNPWNAKQLWWYLWNVINPLQNRVSTCYGQAFSKGIDNILEFPEFQLNRSLKIKTHFSLDTDELFYFPGVNSSLLKRRNFLVSIKYGRDMTDDALGVWLAQCSGQLKSYVKLKASRMEEFKQRVLQPQDVHALGWKSYRC